MNEKDGKTIVTSLDYYEYLVISGIKFASGVPCSAVNKLIHLLDSSDNINYTPAPREDIAVSLSFGYALSTGELPLVLMQNSGIGTSLDALVTEPILYEVPLLLLVTWRGFYKRGIDEIGDEQQHWLWGDITKSVLESAGIKCFELNSTNQFESTTAAILHAKKTKQTCALLLVRNESIHENR